MQSVLVINSGSSSLKWNLYDVDAEQVLAKGLVERIGEATPQHKYSVNGQSTTAGVPGASNHEGALGAVVTVLEQLPAAMLPGGVSGLRAIGHRVVHGGLTFSQPVRIDEAVKAKIRECFPIAPLHNPPNLTGIEACERLMPAVPQVAVFDTAFHTSMPEVAHLYAVPAGFAKEHAIRRYGFHGISHEFVSQQAARHLRFPLPGLKLVTCHLGNGASITAVKGGHSLDTSMGMTPLEGLAMGTRCGDIDPGVVLHLIRALGMTADQVDTMLNRKSGMLGLSGLSNDMREIEDAAQKGNAEANLALDLYCYRIRKYIGAYAAAMEGIDAVVFTAGVGEHSPVVRGRVCAGLAWMGLELDEAVNRADATHRAPLTDITTRESRVKVLVIPTNEELMIAREACATVK